MKTLNKDLVAIQLNQVIEQLTDLADLADYELIAIHNDYCEVNNDSYSHIIDNDDEAIDSMFDSPSEAMRAASFGDYNHSHNYFILNGYANLVSFNYTSDDNCPVDISKLAQWLINEDKLADYDISVTTLDDMLASIEDNITDDKNLLKTAINYLGVSTVYKGDDELTNYNQYLIDSVMEEIKYTDFETIKGVIDRLGIDYK